MTDLIIIMDFVIFVFSFAILYLSRLYLTGNRVYSGGDVFFHLLISKSIRKNGWAFPKALENVTFDEGEKRYDYLAYPPLLHYVSALFPLRTHLAVSKILNIVLLSILASLTANVVYILSLNIGIALIASFITVFNFAIFELEVVFTPRPLGLLFYSFLMFTVIFYPQTVLSVILVAILSTLIILTHKFAIQVIFFTFVPYVLLFNESLFLVGLALGFVLSILLTKGSYFKVLKEHASWLYFYAHFCEGGDFRNKLQRVFARNVWYLPVFFSLFLILFGYSSNLLASNLTLKLFFWAIAPLIIALLITLPKLSFLGENYRYIDYSLVPVGVISAFLFSNLNLYVVLIFVVCILVSIAELVMYRNHIRKSKWLVDQYDISDYQKIKGSNLSNLLVFPPNRTLEVNFFTDLSVIHPVRMQVTETLTEHLERLLRNYDVRYVLRFQGPQPFDKFSVLANLANLKTIMEFKNFEILELSSKEKTNS